jgi:hemerythrin-like domain-containing protein
MLEVRLMDSDYGSARTGERREFLRTITSTVGLALASCAASGARQSRTEAESRELEQEPEEFEEEAEVTPGEDLMQEHGVLERILLVYEEAVRRIESGKGVDVSVVGRGAKIVREFVEDYHERNEERFLFPRLEAAGCEVALVAVLRRQHERGRELTDEILHLISASSSAAAAGLPKALMSFQRMYRPHAAREDTVLFPAFRKLVGRNEYHELGEALEAQEHELFGEGGFERTVVEIGRLEEALGLADLAQFTPS